MSVFPDFGIASHTSLGDFSVAHPSLFPPFRWDRWAGVILSDLGFLVLFGLLGFYHYQILDFYHFYHFIAFGPLGFYLSFMFISHFRFSVYVVLYTSDVIVIGSFGVMLSYWLLYYGGNYYDYLSCIIILFPLLFIIIYRKWRVSQFYLFCCSIFMYYTIY